MAQMILAIGNKNYSSWSLRPWVVMTHFKIPFKEVKIPLFQPGSKEKIFKYSPSGKVPALVYGKVHVWESIAICEYLADLFPQKGLWPKLKDQRAMARAVSAEMHAGFMNMRKAFPMNVRARKPDQERSEDVMKDVNRIKQIWEGCRKTSKSKGQFLFGPFTIADAMFAPVVYRFRTYGVETSGVIKDYCESMLNLPAMREWEKEALLEKHVIEHH
jgi:glutathione S-transferase